MTVTSRLSKAIHAAALCAALLPSTVLAQQQFDVSIDTSPLAGLSGYLAFDLVAGSSGLPNLVEVTAFVTTATLGDSTLTGDASGSLPGPLTLTSTTFFNEVLQQVQFGAGSTTFRLTMGSAVAPGAIPDGFSFFLLDQDFAPFDTSDPTGAGALFVVDLSPPLGPVVFQSTWATATVTPVPELPTVVLLFVGGLALRIGQVGFRRV